MQVNFKAHDGFCPYFEYENIKYFIQERKVDNDWKYTLCSRNTRKEIKSFADKKEAFEWLISIKAMYIDSFGELQLWRKINKIYILEKNIVAVKDDFNEISEYFDNYAECLKFSKQYVTQKIKESEPEQLQIKMWGI